MSGDLVEGKGCRQAEVDGTFHDTDHCDNEGDVSPGGDAGGCQTVHNKQVDHCPHDADEVTSDILEELLSLSACGEIDGQGGEGGVNDLITRKEMRACVGANGEQIDCAVDAGHDADPDGSVD